MGCNRSSKTRNSRSISLENCLLRVIKKSLDHLNPRKKIPSRMRTKRMIKKTRKERKIRKKVNARFSENK